MVIVENLSSSKQQIKELNRDFQELSDKYQKEVKEKGAKLKYLNDLTSNSSE